MSLKLLRLQVNPRRSEHGTDHRPHRTRRMCRPPTRWRRSRPICWVPDTRRDPVGAKRPDDDGHPPELGDTVTVVCRLRITREGEHGPLGRKDGERRYERSMSIQAIWKMGDPEPPLPPDPEAPQPALFGDDDDIDDPARLGDIVNGVDRPGFSDVSE
jgi:hypothetical protein